MKFGAFLDHIHEALFAPPEGPETERQQQTCRGQRCNPFDWPELRIRCDRNPSITATIVLRRGWQRHAKRESGTALDSAIGQASSASSRGLPPARDQTSTRRQRGRRKIALRLSGAGIQDENGVVGFPGGELFARPGSTQRTLDDTRKSRGNYLRASLLSTGSPHKPTLQFSAFKCYKFPDRKALLLIESPIR